LSADRCTRTLSLAEFSDDWRVLVERAVIRAGHSVSGCSWFDYVRGAVENGSLEFEAVGQDPARAGGLLVEVHEGHRIICLMVGVLDHASAEAILKALQARSLAVSWDTEAVPLAAPTGANLGFIPYMRQTFLQDLTRLAPFTAPCLPENLRLRAWDPDDAPAVGHLIADVNIGTLDGLFWTAPAPPTRKHCEQAWQRLLRGDPHALMPDASFVLQAGADIVAAVLLGLQDGTATLCELAVARTWQGRGLSRVLVQAAQRALLERGHLCMRFFSTASNTRVQRLFTREQIVTNINTAGYVWLANERLGH